MINRFVAILLSVCLLSVPVSRGLAQRSSTFEHGDCPRGAIGSFLVQAIPAATTQFPHDSLATPILISITDMIKLGVRMKLRSETTKPAHLYQTLPKRAIPLMATLPRGLAQVSIPHQLEEDKGYPIHRHKVVADGFVIDYALQPNQTYRAEKVLLREGPVIREYSIEDFCAFARQWTEEKYGTIEVLRNQYSYFALSWEEWGSIWGDNGYTAKDPGEGSSEITPKLLQESRGGEVTSGLMMRIPLQHGTKDPRVIFPKFSRVEVTLDPHPSAESQWISFDEFKKWREERSRPPPQILADFREWYSRFARAAGFESWVFRAGMLFNDIMEWWGNFYRRRTQHEGLDFAEGRRRDGQIYPISEGTPVDAMSDGEIVLILDREDFMAKAVITRHPDIVNEQGDVFHMIFMHMHPEPWLDEQTEALRQGHTIKIKKGQLLGKVARTKPNAKTPFHTHLSWAWIPKDIQPHQLTMDKINPGFMRVFLVDPFEGMFKNPHTEDPGEILFELQPDPPAVPEPTNYAVEWQSALEQAWSALYAEAFRGTVVFAAHPPRSGDLVLHTLTLNALELCRLLPPLPPQAHIRIDDNLSDRIRVLVTDTFISNPLYDVLFQLALIAAEPTNSTDVYLDHGALDLAIPLEHGRLYERKKPIPTFREWIRNALDPYLQQRLFRRLFFIELISLELPPVFQRDYKGRVFHPITLAIPALTTAVFQVLQTRMDQWLSIQEILRVLNISPKQINWMRVLKAGRWLADHYEVEHVGGGRSGRTNKFRAIGGAT